MGKFAQEIGLVYITIINGTPIVLINIHEDKIDTWKKSLKDAEADIQNIISEYMNLNSAYISREFKKQFGENLNEYITKVRIEQAKKLLLEKKLTISEISKAVCYDNPRTFTRNFQKLEGITPSAFTKKK